MCLFTYLKYRISKYICFARHILLLPENITTRKHQDEIIKFVERSTMTNFLHDIMAPVATFGKNGFLVQIGRGPGAVVKFVKIHVLQIGGDGAELDWLGGCHNKCVIRNCRLCLDSATSRLVISSERDIEYRNDNQHEFIVKRMGELWKLRILAAAQNHRHVMSEEQVHLESKFNTLDLTPGKNPL